MRGPVEVALELAARDRGDQVRVEEALADLRPAGERGDLRRARSGPATPTAPASRRSRRTRSGATWPPCSASRSPSGTAANTSSTVWPQVGFDRTLRVPLVGRRTSARRRRRGRCRSGERRGSLSTSRRPPLSRCRGSRTARAARSLRPGASCRRPKLELREGRRVGVPIPVIEPVALYESVELTEPAGDQLRGCLLWLR